MKNALSEPFAEVPSEPSAWNVQPNGASRDSHRRTRRNRFYLRFGKRVLDVLVSGMALAVSCPVLLVSAIAIWVDSPGPILYRQWRVGRNGQPFQIIKLRTMIPNADRQGPRVTASGDSRITKVGRILRKTKVDELPQFFNVLTGAMTLVGPRPELPEFVAEYTDAERRVLEIKPGVTGPATVCYVDEERVLAASGDRVKFYIEKVMRDKLELDLAYAQNISFPTDLGILRETFTSMLRFRGSRTRSEREGSFGIEPRSVDSQSAAEGNHNGQSFQ
jgi:lipopolysaccharide/colanic/teichoic acid biosynthesis glycosyltransferase